MRIAALQHVPYEGPAHILRWAEGGGHLVTVVRLDRDAPLPQVSEFDMLVIMGGPMSVNQERRHPWLVPEKRLVLDAITARKPVLGICLGAQLIASALGARVYPSTKEIGWFSVRRTASAADAQAFSAFPDIFVPLHWHGETFDLPPNATRTATTDACENQAFQLGDRTVGLQFHLEATVASVAALIENAGSEIAGGAFEQAPEQIQREADDRSDATWPLIAQVLEYLTDRAMA